MRVVTLTGTVLLVACAIATPSRGSDRVQRVSREAIVAAMHVCRGYSLTATANGPRLQADVLLQLIREAEASDPSHRPLVIGHQEWFDAFLEHTGLEPQEAPLYVRLSYEVKQDLVVDYDKGHVIEKVLEGPKPRIAANIHIFWPDSVDSDSYSYDDTLSSPTLRVTDKRDIQYRLVDYGDRLWYTEVSGLYGRPTSGALGLLFDLVGEAQILDSRSAFAPDGIQIVRAQGRRLGITRTVIATIWPDGHADNDVPHDRPDLEVLARRLEEPLEIRFRPFDDHADSR